MVRITRIALPLPTEAFGILFKSKTGLTPYHGIQMPPSGANAQFRKVKRGRSPLHRLAETVFTRARTNRGVKKSGVSSLDGGNVKGWSA
jgi:hypothetical protein